MKISTFLLVALGTVAMAAPQAYNIGGCHRPDFWTLADILTWKIEREVMAVREPGPDGRGGYNGDDKRETEGRGGYNGDDKRDTEGRGGYNGSD
jgi:hypothetical protein